MEVSGTSAPYQSSETKELEHSCRDCQSQVTIKDQEGPTTSSFNSSIWPLYKADGS